MYKFSDRLYKLEHFKAPRGSGHWAFLIMRPYKGISPEQCIFTDVKNEISTVFWIPGSWTLTEAKREAKKLLKAAGVPDVMTIYVAP